MRAFTRGTVTHHHTFALGLLVALALIEEPDTEERARISKGAQLHSVETTLLDHLRRFVTHLRLAALPGGELDLAAGAWLSLEENGGNS